MKDKLTKKRIRVDYELIIRVLNLDLKFSEYLWSRDKTISIRRLALAFLRGQKVDIEAVWNSCLEHGLKSYDDWLKENKRIVDYNIWEND